MMIRKDHLIDDPAHVAICARCRRLHDLAARLGAAGVTDDQAIDDRSLALDELTSELLALPLAKRLAAVRADRYLSIALAQRFSMMASNEYDDLHAALDHAQVATVIADRLAVKVGRVPDLQFETWKVRSTIHRERGEGGAARAASIRAAAALPGCSDRELKLAILDYADATICATRDVWEPMQAFALLDRCEPVFALRDPIRCVHARALRGTIHLQAGDDNAAKHVYEVVLAETDPADRAAYADAQRNLANALLNLGEIETGTVLLAEARATDMALGRTLRLVKDDSLAALAAEKRGDYETAAAGYADTRERFAAAGEVEVSVLEGKSQAVSLVVMGRIQEARAVLRDLLAVTVGDSDRRRFTADALAYLRDLADASQITHDIAASVGHYIDRIHHQRATPFVPPMSRLTM